MPSTGAAAPAGIPVRRVCGLVAYDGTEFYGFQVQRGGPTIQGALEAALARITGEPCRVVGSGRTDTGVHARGQVVMAQVPWRHSLDALERAWNHFLPRAILVRRLVPVPDSRFHPRFSATARTYRYTVYHPGSGSPEGHHRFPLYDRYGLVVPQRLDLEAMNQAASCLVGEHDFATFGQPPEGETRTVRVIHAAFWERLESSVAPADLYPWEALVFTVTGNAFLRRMVRNLVSSLLAVGQGEWDVAAFQDALTARDRSRSRPPAPPQGLVLERVDYADYPDLFRTGGAEMGYAEVREREP